jgi:hypothetical protein
LKKEAKTFIGFGWRRGCGGTLNGAHALSLLGANGAALDTLMFDGKYRQADFALQAVQNGTEVGYAGAEPTALRLVSRFSNGWHCPRSREPRADP